MINKSLCDKSTDRRGGTAQGKAKNPIGQIPQTQDWGKKKGCGVVNNKNTARVNPLKIILRKEIEELGRMLHLYHTCHLFWNIFINLFVKERGGLSTGLFPKMPVMLRLGQVQIWSQELTQVSPESGQDSSTWSITSASQPAH